MTIRIPRNAKKVFCATESTTREGGIRCAGREQNSTTFSEARKFLDNLGVPGGVTLWTAISGRTNDYATRHADGSWTARNWLTGKDEPIA